MEAPGSDIKVGGTSGGFGTFMAGAALTAISAWFFVDSVRVTSRGYGWISNALGANTGSAGIVFLPLFVAVVWLFVDAKRPWPWALFAIGLALLAVEILSRLEFLVQSETVALPDHAVRHGERLGMIIRSLRAMPPEFLES